MQVCEVACDSFFKKVVLFRDSKLEEAAQRCLEAFFGYGLRPPQIELRRRDHAFNYELTFSLFNGNGTFAVSAEKIHIHIKNATSSKDVEGVNPKAIICRTADTEVSFVTFIRISLIF